MKTLSLQTAPKTVLMNALRLVVFISLSNIVSTAVMAAQSAEEWQVKRLLHPTTAQRASEQHGSVFIYDGLSDKDIDKAMDQDFDRIDSMMFINVKPAIVTKNKSNQSQPDEEEDDMDDAGCE